jgi:hypothetical protein
MTIFRIYYATRGAHVHCRVFAGEDHNLALCGKVVMDWHDFKVWTLFATESAAIGGCSPAIAAACQWFFFQEQCRDGESITESIVAEWLSLPTAMRTKERLLEILNQ